MPPAAGHATRTFPTSSRPATGVGCEFGPVDLDSCACGGSRSTTAQQPDQNAWARTSLELARARAGGPRESRSRVCSAPCSRPRVVGTQRARPSSWRRLPAAASRARPPLASRRRRLVGEIRRSGRFEEGRSVFFGCGSFSFDGDSQSTLRPSVFFRCVQFSFDGGLVGRGVCYSRPTKAPSKEKELGNIYLSKENSLRRHGDRAGSLPPAGTLPKRVE